jgi:DNA-binding protein H-NS
MTAPLRLYLKILMTSILTPFIQGIKQGGAMCGNDDFQSMSSDELWTIYEKIGAILSPRFEAEKRHLEQRLDELGRTSMPQSPVRGASSKLLPRFRNPMQPAQLWTGRGRRPRWFSELIKAGKSIDELRIKRKV